MNLPCARLHVRHFVQVSHFILTILSSWCCYAHFTDEETKTWELIQGHSPVATVGLEPRLSSSLDAV